MSNVKHQLVVKNWRNALKLAEFSDKQIEGIIHVMQEALLTSNDLVTALRGDIAELKAETATANKRHYMMQGLKAVPVVVTLIAGSILALAKIWDLISPLF